MFNEEIKCKKDIVSAASYYFTDRNGVAKEFTLEEAVRAKEWELGRELNELRYDPKTTFPLGILEKEFELVALITWLAMCEKHQQDMADVIYRSHHF